MIRAQELIASSRKKAMPLKERQQKSIELAAAMLLEAERIQSLKEKTLQAQLARMMKDPKGKVFTTCMTDECFRSHRTSRVANQMVYLLQKFGIPSYLSLFKRIQLWLFVLLGRPFSFLFVPIAIAALRRETSSVILPGESNALSRHMKHRRMEGVRLNLNHLGEAILGEDEAKKRLQVYLDDLEKHDIEYVSIKISTIYSQIHLLSWEHTLHQLKDHLRKLYRSAMRHTFTRADGTSVSKFVNLDMEEYRDLHLTKELFKQVLDEPEFLPFSAGIVLQAYLPDSYTIQKELTEWSMQRMQRGGAPIKIRIVKGANLAMEQFEASLRGWQQAPYTKKSDVDANYKRMVAYACAPAHAKAVSIGIGSHNLFDIAYALLLRAEKGVEKEIVFEMLEGMADHMRRVVQFVADGMLLYCPVATKEDFQSAVAYLIRRLDENTGPDNFLRHTFGLRPHTPEWDAQVSLFIKACEEMETVSAAPRRTQNRELSHKSCNEAAPFENEPDTDFSLHPNRHWAWNIATTWQKKTFPEVPLVIGGKEIRGTKQTGEGTDPSRPGQSLYTYALADWDQIDHALNVASSAQKTWQAVPVRERSHLLAACADKMREHRGDLIGVMIVDGGKTILEGDPEVSEAIDFAEYYRRSMLKMDACKDVLWQPKGTILITPPWNFPVSIPAGGILAALMAGNTVLFKPAPEAVLTGWVLVNTLWEAGVPKDVLQFINCPDDPIGSRLIGDPRIDAVVLTGATSTAKLFKKLNPSLDLAAETGGKNAMIITALSDRDLAIKDLVQSAFGHAGQKCSATSLAILEAEVYDDPHFLHQLRDAVLSLHVGSAWDLSTKMPPLIRPPGKELLRGLTTLDAGESWLVKPEQDPNNPHLWTPGVKLGVKEGSFMHQTELFGPVLSVMRADHLKHALHLANGTAYGLTSGLQSLDDREQKIWMHHIVAGNCYINRTTTGAIVRRQPFGGCKGSNFGAGAKAGGPNYMTQFCSPAQVGLPQEKDLFLPQMQPIERVADLAKFDAEQLGLWHASLASYSYWSKRFAEDHDPSKVVGQDNLFRYRPFHDVVLRLSPSDSPLDVFRSIAAALAMKSRLEISYTKDRSPVPNIEFWHRKIPSITWVRESEQTFLERVSQGKFQRIRVLSKPSEALYKAAAEHASTILANPVLANGRFEMLHYLREISLSIDYHRYGNLGLRDQEKRAPIL
ncbi:MAG: bifunctional proline dehydrogenase/L-glutamate gamma-semialdehyde dehydrogenase [Simkania sp.]|nr:bifunctional proline dehydrogenase/L-glutamate gamma-semialdehyde dehydrogenase [Simkania sp.]